MFHATRHIAGAVLASLLAGCISKQPETVPLAEDAPERIAYFGHGKLFDAGMQEIRLDMRLQQTLLDTMLQEIEQFPGSSAAKAENKATAARVRERLRAGGLNSNETLLLKNVLIQTLLETAPRELRDKYQWRNEALFFRHWNSDVRMRAVPPWLLQLIVQTRFLFAANQGTPSSYMNDCSVHGVPIPPDWAETGTAWRKQGNLTSNLLQPGAHAEVWTYSDSAARGACVALPRGSGGPGSLAGIICQSASTGHACFWDNQLRSAPAEVLGWSGQRLVIADLVDGSNMADSKNCTQCHRGNNVFLISPDDPTWARALRGPLLGGASGGSFTTQVQTSSDNRGGHPRYIPVTTLPPRPGWDNVFSASSGCAGACHEPPVVSRPPMPPACAAGGVANCYGTP